MELEKSLQDEIKKNLPEQVGTALRQRLEEADLCAFNFKQQKEVIESLNKAIQEKDRIIAEYKIFDARNALLNEREKEVCDKERLLEVECLKYQLLAEKEKTAFSQNVALGLVRNVEYRKNIFDTETIGGLPVVDGLGNYHYPIPSSKNYTSTSEAK